MFLNNLEIKNAFNMGLQNVHEDLDEVFLQFASEIDSRRTIELFGEEYTVLGVDLNLVDEIAIIQVDNFKNINKNERIKFIRSLVKSEVFEKIWLGYKIWKQSISMFPILNQSEIMELRPKSGWIFNYWFASCILPFYVRSGIIDKKVLKSIVLTKENYLTLEHQCTLEYNKKLRRM